MTDIVPIRRSRRPFQLGVHRARRRVQPHGHRHLGGPRSLRDLQRRDRPVQPCRRRVVVGEGERRRRHRQRRGARHGDGLVGLVDVVVLREHGDHRSSAGVPGRDGERERSHRREAHHSRLTRTAHRHRHRGVLRARVPVEGRGHRDRGRSPILRELRMRERQHHELARRLLVAQDQPRGQHLEVRRCIHGSTHHHRLVALVDRVVVRRQGERRRRDPREGGHGEHDVLDHREADDAVGAATRHREGEVGVRRPSTVQGRGHRHLGGAGPLPQPRRVGLQHHAQGLAAGDGEGVGPGRDPVLCRHLDLDGVVADLEVHLEAVGGAVRVRERVAALVEIRDRGGGLVVRRRRHRDPLDAVGHRCGVTRRPRRERRAEGPRAQGQPAQRRVGGGDSLDALDPEIRRLVGALPGSPDVASLVHRVVVDAPSARRRRIFRTLGDSTDHEALAPVASVTPDDEVRRARVELGVCRSGEDIDGIGHDGPGVDQGGDQAPRLLAVKRVQLHARIGAGVGGVDQQLDVGKYIPGRAGTRREGLRPHPVGRESLRVVRGQVMIGDQHPGGLRRHRRGDEQARQQDARGQDRDAEPAQGAAVRRPRCGSFS